MNTFGDAIAVQDLSDIHVWNFIVRFFPNPNQNSRAVTDTKSILSTSSVHSYIQNLRYWII